MDNADRRLLLTGAGLAGMAGLAAMTTAKAGSLNPPGAPAPTGKTTTEIEPRTAVQSLSGDGTAMKIISQPGSYYLTGNIAGSGAAGSAGIAITASNVTLDLRGFAVTGAPTMTSGIELRGTITNVAICNGRISGWPACGVKVAAAGSASGMLMEALTISGCADTGIDTKGSGAQGGAVVSRCTVSACGCGITAPDGVVEGCVVTGISAPVSFVSWGISAQTVQACLVSGVSAPGTADVYGIIATGVAMGCTVANVNCTGSALSVGIRAGYLGEGGTVTGCSLHDVGSGAGTGITQGIDASVVTDCSLVYIGYSSTRTGVQYGIIGDTVTGCSLDYVGSTGQSGMAYGINAANGGVVENCRLRQVNSGSSVYGITAPSSVVRGCAVTYMNAFTAGSFTVTGIVGARVQDCEVTNITCNTTALATAINGSQLVSGCVVSALSNANSGGIAGIVDSGVARIDGNQVSISGTAVGIKSTGTSFVVCNRVIGGTQYQLTGAGQYGPVVPGATASIVSTSPWANFSL